MSQMNLYTSAHILHQIQREKERQVKEYLHTNVSICYNVKSVCVLVLLYIPLSMMHIPGPCRHSITNDHLLQINHLINNHLRNGCSISYVFIEKRHLSSVCYVKAALPRVLDLLSVHFRYSRGSESALLVRSLQNLIHNIYSQRCVPPLNEQLEEDPVVFLKQFTDSPIQALQRAKEVLDIYLQLITQTHTNTSMDWSCAMEYSNYTTVVITELPRTHRTEATQVMLGQVEQDSSDLSFYKLGFTVLAVSGGIFLLITVSCLIHRKRFHQLRRQDMELDTWSDVSHIEFCSTAFNRMDLII
ncbi:macrophage colony-stimulating factor 1b isoform X1 [Ictalurus furcatus]|uniref:macrophage colony-stimulating factor 1b isoform X1 n=1 Tax=Ictalurus furcatus TaxID=66913 RepID=UPI0023504795|nr:macrophage colony-stimulating factor 1b isoform X1 [Ictalurus furcatus]